MNWYIICIHWIDLCGYIYSYQWMFLGYWEKSINRCISVRQSQQVHCHFPIPATATSARHVKHRPASKGKQAWVTQLVPAFPVLLIKLLISRRIIKTALGPPGVFSVISVISVISPSSSSSSSVRVPGVCRVRRSRTSSFSLSPKAAGEAQQHSSTTAVATRSNNTASQRIVSDSESNV